MLPSNKNNKRLVIKRSIIRDNRKINAIEKKIIIVTFPHRNHLFGLFDEIDKPYKYNVSNIIDNLVENRKNISHLRWTLDMKEDLILIRKIISKIKKRPILMNDVLELFSKEPELISINEHLAKSGGTKI